MADQDPELTAAAAAFGAAVHLVDDPEEEALYEASLKRIADRALTELPSPLAAFKRGGASLRTGLTHLYNHAHDETAAASAVAFRARCRSGEFASQTSGQAPGFVQANFVALPQEYAFDFLRFCLRNPRACPLLDVTDAGDSTPRTVAPSADLRTDIPKYCVWRRGAVAESPSDVSSLWTDDMVGFLLGCSFSWEDELAKAGLPPRHVEEGRNVPMYLTDVPNAAVGPFGGRLVVSMRPYRPDQIARVAEITSRYPGAHGGPVHWGDHGELGLVDLSAPDFGDAVTIKPGEVPVFWACGVTPQAALAEAALPLAVTHAPGHMLVTDVREAALEVPA